MKRAIILLTLLGLVGSATASTIANWRFEEGATGVGDVGTHAGDWDNHYQDISGNGNHMSSWPLAEPHINRPVYTADVPFGTVPQTGAANNLALDFTAGPQDIGTFGAQTGPKMVDSYLFTDWTVEVSFKLTALGVHQVIVGKDGKKGDLGGAPGLEPPFWMKILPWNNHLEVLCLDDNENPRWTGSAAPLVANEWYSAAARYDGAGLDLWLKGPGDSEYQFQNAVLFTDGASLGGYNQSWNVGRGTWDGNPVDYLNGFVDEVRISDNVVAPNDFIAVPEPATLGLFGLIGGGMLWIRKRFTI